MQPRVAVITGASSGIGQACAFKLAVQGHHVVLAAPRTDHLDAITRQIIICGGTPAIRPVDVIDRARLVSMVDSVVEEFGRVDVLVHCAGLMPLARAHALLDCEWGRHTIDMNIRGLLDGITATLPHFQGQGSGHFVDIASIGGHAVMPTSAVRSARRYATRAIAKALQLESLASVRASAISPGMVAIGAPNTVTDPAVERFVRAVSGVAIPPQAIAAAIFFAMSRQPEVNISEVIIRPAVQRK